MIGKISIKEAYDSLGRYKALCLLSALELISILAYSLISGDGEVLNSDIRTYFAAYDVLMSGKLDIFRTPLFPLFIGGARALFGAKLGAAIVYIIQSALFLCSIRWMGILVGNITANSRVSYWFTAVYALYPGVLSFCGMLMTESLSVSLTTCVLYQLSEAYDRRSWKMASLSGVTCILQLMLRPAFITIPLIMLVFWIVLMLSAGWRCKTAVYGLCASVASIAALCLYSWMYYNEYHKFAQSSVSTINNYVMLHRADIIAPEHADTHDMRIENDPVITDRSPERNRFDDAAYLIRTYGLDETDRFIKEQIRRQPAALLAYLYQDRLELMLNYNGVYTGAAMPHFMRSLTRLIRVNTGVVFFIFILGLLLQFYSDVKDRKISYFVWLLYAVFAANYLTLWLGAPDGFDRLSACNYPVLIAVSCLVLDKLVYFATQRPARVSGPIA